MHSLYQRVGCENLIQAVLLAEHCGIVSDSADELAVRRFAKDRLEAIDQSEFADLLYRRKAVFHVIENGQIGQVDPSDTPRPPTLQRHADLAQHSSA